MSERLKLRLSVDVVYDRNGVPEKKLRDLLMNVAIHAYGEGAITGETGAEVKQYTFSACVVDEEITATEGRGWERTGGLSL